MPIGLLSALLSPAVTFPKGLLSRANREDSSGLAGMGLFASTWQEFRGTNRRGKAMNAVLRYGSGDSLALELLHEPELEVCDAPRGTALADVAAAADRALAEPVDFPPLERAALPGDRVALAIEPGVPRVATILARTVAALVAAEVAPADIHIVRATAEPADVLGEIPEAIRREVVSAVHDPSSRQALSYLAATADARPIYVNRAIHDADLVVSIGALRLDDAPGYHGTNAGVFPTFSDAATIARYRSSKSDEARRRRRLDRQSDEAAWLLGARFTIEVVPGAGDEVLHVLAGDSAAVSRQGRELCEAAWRYPLARPASLVVATIEGDATAQTWDNAGRALASASRALSARRRDRAVHPTGRSAGPGAAEARWGGGSPRGGARHRSRASGRRAGGPPACRRAGPGEHLPGQPAGGRACRRAGARAAGGR